MFLPSMMLMIGEHGISVNPLNLIDLQPAPDKSPTLVKGPTHRPSENIILTVYMQNVCGLKATLFAYKKRGKK